MRGQFLEVIIQAEAWEWGIICAVFALAVTALVIFITMVQGKKKKNDAPTQSTPTISNASAPADDSSSKDTTN